MTDAFDAVVVVNAAGETVAVDVPILNHKRLLISDFQPILNEFSDDISSLSNPIEYLIQHFHKDVARTGAGERRHRGERRGLVVPRRRRRRRRRHRGKVDIARAVDRRAVEAKILLRLLLP